MEEHELRRIRLFLREADKIKTSTLISSGKEPEIKLNISYHKNQGGKNTLTAPHDDPIIALASSVRKCLLKSEEIEFEKIAKFVSRNLPDKQREINEVVEWFKGILNAPTPMVVVFEGKKLTTEYCLNLYLNGSVFHSNPSKSETYDRLQVTPGAGFVDFIAKTSILLLTKPIIRLGEIAIDMISNKETK